MALNLGSILVKIIGDNTDLNNKLNEAEKQAQGFAKRLSTSLTKAGTAMTLGVTLPLVGVGVAVGKIASDFEAQMAILEVAARNSGESVEELRAVALKAGADTSLLGINASETADAITGLYKAGLTSSEIFGDLEGYLEGSAEMAGAFRAAVDLAAASDLELAAASDAVAIAMATFGLSGEDAVGIANSFVRAADASVAEVSELTQALANVGPTAAQFGWSLDDTNTALALLSERGIRGSEAGTALKSMMTNLMRPTEDVVSALANLNIKLYDQEGHLKSLPQLVGELEGAMDGLTEEQRNQTIQAIAGTYGMKAMSTLLAEGAVGWDEMTKAIGGAATAQEVAEVRMDTFAGVMEAFKGTIETFMIQAGRPLLDNFVRPLIERLTVIIGKITEADPKFFELGVKIALAAAAAGPLLLIAGKLVAVIGMIASPVGLAVAALGLLALAWKNNWGGIRDKMLPALEEVKGAIAKAWPVVQGFVSDVTAAFKSEGLKGAIEEFKAKWPELTTGISEAVGPLVEKVKTWLDNAVSAVKTWVAENAPKVKDFLAELPQKVMDALQDFASSPLVAKVAAWLASVPPAVSAWVAENAPKVGEFLKGMFT
ncbi:MAG: phage tail tape measure protein, partial [Chloroflexi bacterium]|nr:phage tail tape measure protein [Chloroflexota bacterium]